MLWKTIGKNVPINVLLSILRWMGYDDMALEIKKQCPDINSWSSIVKYKLTPAHDKFVFRLNYTILNCRGGGKPTPVPDYKNKEVSKKFKFWKMQEGFTKLKKE